MKVPPPQAKCCIYSDKIWFLAVKRFLSIHIRPVVLKVGGIAPLGAILRGKGVNKTKRAIGGKNNTKGKKTLNH